MSDQIQRDDGEWQMLLNNAYYMVDSLTNRVEARDAQVESLQRENEELRSLRDLKSADGAELNMRANLLGLIDPDLSNTHDSYTVFQLAWIEITNQRRRITELEAAAITPEMREKAEAALSEYVNWQRYGKCVEVVRDLLGEQGGMGDE